MWKEVWNFKAPLYDSLQRFHQFTHKHRQSIHALWLLIFSLCTCQALCFVDTALSSYAWKQCKFHSVLQHCSIYECSINQVFSLYISSSSITELTDLQSANLLTSSNCLPVCHYCACNMNSPSISLSFPSHSLLSYSYVSPHTSS